MQTFMERFSEMAFERGMMVGEAKGEARGEARGISIGEATATRRLIVTLLGQRFDIVPMTSSAKLKEIADLDTLTYLTTAVLKVGSLEEFDAMLDKALKDGKKDK